jgi:ribonuclease HI
LIYHDALNIYTDGSSFPKPRKGGVGMLFVFLDDDGIEEIIIEKDLLGYHGATNNQMELQAVVLALKVVPTLDLSVRVGRIVVFTDSMYVKENYPRSVGWSKNKWLNKDGAPVANALQWKELLKTVKEVGYRVSIQWIKGHAKNSFNKKVDKSAKKSAQGLLQSPLQYTDVRRKVTDKLTRRGSVVMEGQKVVIRIVTSEYQKLQKLFKYRYEVISKKSKYCGNVDFIFFEEVLRTAHTYYVRLNDEPKNPRIVKLIKEIVKRTPTDSSEE